MILQKTRVETTTNVRSIETNFHKNTSFIKNKKMYETIKAYIKYLRNNKSEDLLKYL
ncbi:Uncharacterized protein FWK35_00032073 [Aphis craccivora]|uniref:Uncharacterized protein n=1 Tax=Aphis craccivora TaxID=307492 RepID=A0A6G0WNJ3_APHCR|nr:Uncharacterized protein FWK35_00032073 [Aphis craccivora]